MSDDFPNWDEHEAEERRRQELLARHRAGGFDDDPEIRTISLYAGPRPDPDVADKRGRFEDDPPEGVLPLPPAKDHRRLKQQPRQNCADYEDEDNISVSILAAEARFEDEDHFAKIKLGAGNGSADAESLGEWDAGDDDQLPSPRGWLLGNTFCRQFISSVVAPGGVGKTALRLAQLISLAIGRALTGEHVFMRCRVLLVSLEDDADELRRRLRAVCLYHGVTQAELKGWLFLATPGAAGGKLMVQDPRGRPVVGALATKLADTIKARRIDVCSIDPFVKCHSIEENSNSMIDKVVQILSDMAAQFNCAIDVPHHTAKGQADPGNADRGRGASAMKDAGRLVYTLTPMTTVEAQAFGLSEAQRRYLIRLDSAKVNIMPPMADAKWFRLVGIDIGNGTDAYPNGDSVQTIEPWTPPGLFTDLSIPVLNAILDDIDTGMPDGNRYSDAPKADERAVWCVIERHCPGKGEGPARRIIKTWTGSGLLVSKKYRNPITRKEVSGLWVDSMKRPS